MVPSESECVHVLAATLSREIIQDLWAKLAFFKRMWFRIQVPNLANSDRMNSGLEDDENTFLVLSKSQLTFC